MLKNKEVAHNFLWGIESSNTNLHGIGNKLFSYNTVIAQWEDGILIGNNTKYSVSTSKHSSYIKHRIDVYTSKRVPIGCKDLIEYILCNINSIISMKTKVVPFHFENDMEDLSREENVNVVGIEEMSITYMQLPDTNSSSDEYQHLKITTRTACSVGKIDTDKKDGYYFDITIPEGEHWSVDDGKEIQVIIEDFKERLYKTFKQK